MISSVQTKRKEGVPFIEGTPSHCIEKKLYLEMQVHCFKFLINLRMTFYF